MSNSANQLGGKCPYMPYLGRGQMSGGEHVLHSRKPTIWVFDQVRHKPTCTLTEDGYRLEILDLESRGIVLSM